MAETPDIAGLPNLGPKSAAWLADVGIHTRAQLEAAGPVEAFQLVRDTGANPSLNLLWAMAGALADQPWELLPESFKAELLKELNEADPPPPTSGQSF